MRPSPRAGRYRCERPSKLVVDSVNNDVNIKKVVQKLLTMSVADHDFSAQEACHLLTGEQLVTCSRSFIVTSLDGGREVDQDTAQQDEGDVATHPSLLDMYMNRPRNQHFEVMCSMDFAAGYRITVFEIPTRLLANG